ncbi:hypothetical protein ACT4JQ_001202 [Yersinia enterocolitica]
MNNNWPAYTGNNEIVNAIDITSVKQLEPVTVKSNQRTASR